MEYSESICFSATPAEKLNQKAFLLNRSLYLFAYYEPKPYVEKESSKSKFLTAIINLYGLFWDCGPFVFELFYSRDSILINDWNLIRRKANELREGISGFRSVFCHNCSDQFPLNEESIEKATYWASRYSHGWQSIDEISEAEWGKLLLGLVKEANSLICDVDVALDTLEASPDISRREKAINRWIKKIAIGYHKNPEYLLNTMVGLYQLFLSNSHITKDPVQGLRKLTIEWVCNYINCKDTKQWYATWLEPTVEIEDTKLYAILKNWPNRWAAWSGCSADDCNEPPMPASIFFRILAEDIDRYACQPWNH